MGKSRQDTLNRLKRIEGQVRGIAQMVSDDRYCIDVLHQVQAVKAALAKVESAILKDHAACCVAEARSTPARCIRKCGRKGPAPARSAAWRSSPKW
jgi:DNA-binding FrmR family transcriptional regulator